jgi:hypothetical protein
MIGEKKMEVQILSFFNIIEDNVVDLVKCLKHDTTSDERMRESIQEALRCSVQAILQKHFEDDPYINLTLTVADPISSRIDGCEMCDVQRTPDGTYLIRGDNKLSKDLQEKLGPRAKRFKQDN